MGKKAAFLFLLLVVACEQSSVDPVELSHANQFDLRANWSASANPVGSAQLRATLAIKEYLGSRMEAVVSLTGGANNTAYQWRIFRGDCSVTFAAASNTAPTGLLLFATIQSYPDITTGVGGTGSQTRVIAGALDSLTSYSVRVRIGQASTNWNGTSPLACGNLQRS